MDGTTTVEWATGTYVLVQSIKPQDHYFAPDTVVTFVNGETHEVTVLNESYPLLTIIKTNESGVILPGFCFKIFNDKGDGTAGTAVNGATNFATTRFQAMKRLETASSPNGCPPGTTSAARSPRPPVMPRLPISDSCSSTRPIST